MVKGISFRRPYTDVGWGITGLIFFMVWAGLLLYAFCAKDWSVLDPKEGLMLDFMELCNSRAILRAVIQSLGFCLVLNVLVMVLLRNCANIITMGCIFVVMLMLMGIIVSAAFIPIPVVLKMYMIVLACPIVGWVGT